MGCWSGRGVVQHIVMLEGGMAACGEWREVQGRDGGAWLPVESEERGAGA